MAKANPQRWILLRGLSRESAHWGDFLPLLQNRFPEAQIHTLDLPGTGQRHRETSPCSIEEITRTLRNQAQAQGLLQHPVILLSLSLGGMVGWEWMQKYPADIKAASLINTSMAGLSPFYQRLRWQSYGSFLKIIGQRNGYRRELAIIRCIANRRDLDGELARQWWQVQEERPVTLSNTARQLWAAARYRPANRRPETPVLLLSGRGDRLVSPACSEAIQTKWKIPLQTHPWAGHDLPIDDGSWVVDRLAAWLAQLNKSGEII